MTKYLLAAIAGLSLVLIGAFWRIDHISTSLESSSQRVRELEASEQSRKNTIRLLGELDAQHTQEITHARTEYQALLDRIGSGNQRLSVLAHCPAVRTPGSAAGVDDAEARAELDPAHARRIVAIPAEGDDAIRQLTALQDWVRTACMPQ